MVHNAKRTGHETDKDIETPGKNMSKGPKHCTPIVVISGFLTLAIIGMLVHLEIQIFDIKSKLTRNGKCMQCQSLRHSNKQLIIGDLIASAVVKTEDHIDAPGFDLANQTIANRSTLTTTPTTIDILPCTEDLNGTNSKFFINNVQYQKLEVDSSLVR